MLWIRKVGHKYAVATLHTPHVRDRNTYRALPLHFKLSNYDCDTFMLPYFRSYGICVTYVWQIEAAMNVWRFFETGLKNLPHPPEPLRMRSCSISATKAFDAVAFLVIRNTPYVHKPIRK